MKVSYNRVLIPRARQLRSNMTDAERKLWSHIRMTQLKGFQFFRQRPVGEYIADFYCPRAKLVIEVDGGQHYTSVGKESDKKRDKYLQSLGLIVCRYSDTDVLNNIEGVISQLLEVLPESK